MIKLENVEKVYPGGVRALKGISMEIASGETVTLVGPSGCGKTTTLKLINRLIEPTKGRIFIHDEDIAKKDPVKLRRQIGYSIQEVGLFPHMTVEENIAVVPKLLGWPKSRIKKRAEELLKLVRMEPERFSEKYPRQLSGGQRQRIGVARSLGGDPPLLLMDEPFGALDPITRKDLQEEFIDIQKKVKKTIVFVTHDLSEALKLGDRIAIMRDGGLEQFDTRKRLLREPANKFVERFLGGESGRKTMEYLRVDGIMDEMEVLQEAPLERLKKRFVEEDIDVALITDDEGLLKGIARRERLEEGGAIEQVRSIDGGASLWDGMKEMWRNNLEYLAVVDSDKKPIGIVTKDEIMRFA